MKSKLAFILSLFLIGVQSVFGQTTTIQIIDSLSRTPITNALIQGKNYSELTDRKGKVLVKNTNQTYLISKDNYASTQLKTDSNQRLYVVQLARLPSKTKTIKKVKVKGGLDNSSFLNGVGDMSIFAGKKSEVIVLDSLTVNTSANTSSPLKNSACCASVNPSISPSNTSSVLGSIGSKLSQETIVIVQITLNSKILVFIILFILLAKIYLFKLT